ncbi:hypothetical protein OEZ85_007908 [Tetradesmus obliquus]|uniref:PsbP C-terminal domain-containing protein n=1 Tax=Tetradesmus obliquus TaxID=3088 RepID=A0ABY8THN5_TETOB|nr:hypothetical protein OEZ85_007908 [Tetradesmus obliquus]
MRTSNMSLMQRQSQSTQCAFKQTGRACQAVSTARSRRLRHTVQATDPQQQQQQTEDAPGQPAPARLNLANPAETIVWGGRLPSTRRLTLSGLAALGITLGGNLGGVTSWLLGLDGGQLAATLHADVLIPVLGYKRCQDAGNGYEFQYPAQWLADQTLLYRAAQRAEAARSLDPQPLRQKRKDVVEPSAAFGPAGSTGEENISVVVAPIFQGFKLESLGAADAAGRYFLDNIVAPAGSDKTATLIAAQERRDTSGVLYYQLEFTVESAKFSRHNVAVLASRDDLLYTLNAQCPASRWQQDGQQLLHAAASFRLSGSPSPQYPGSL